MGGGYGYVYRGFGRPRDIFGVVGNKSCTRSGAGEDGSCHRRGRRSRGFGRWVLAQSFVCSCRKVVRDIKTEVYSVSPGVVKGWGPQWREWVGDSRNDIQGRGMYRFLDRWEWVKTMGYRQTKDPWNGVSDPTGYPKGGRQVSNTGWFYGTPTRTT